MAGKSTQRLLRAGGLTIVAALLAAAVVSRLDRAIAVVTGVIAHDVCSKTFISGFDPAVIMRETLTRPGIRRLRWLLSDTVDTSAKAVTASFAGVISARAVYRDGLGCVVMHGSAQPMPVTMDLAQLRAAGGLPALPPIADAAVVIATDAKLKAAIDTAFVEPAVPPLRLTKAVVIVHNGRIIAERYAAGAGPETPLLGFSLTKTTVNALIGVLVRQGRLKVSDPAPVAGWSKPDDPRHAITIEHLMRMASGLDFDETNSGFDRSSQMLYLHDDMAGFAARTAPIAAPGTRFAYASPGTVLLGRIIRDAVGGRPEDVLEFAWRELFHPLGMRNVTLEFDGAGNLMASSYMFASARDWARLGQLYLNDGMAGERRVLPEGWVDFSARSTLGSYYGAGVWTLRSEHPWARRWAEMGIPSDAFFGSGDLGQRIMVIPSQKLVIVRLGDAVDPNGDMPGLARLVRETIAALQK